MKHLLEMAQITKKGKTVLADGKKLKDVDFSELSDNIALIYLENGTFFSAPGTFWIYFISDPKWSTDFKEGKSDLLLFPVRHRFNIFSSRPILDIWKKSHTKDVRNADLIIGAIQGVHENDKVYIEMMSVRPAYKRNSINKKMLDSLIKDKDSRLYGKDLVWEDPTEDGLNFIHSYSGQAAEFRWTINHRPNNMEELYPEQEN